MQTTEVYKQTKPFTCGRSAYMEAFGKEKSEPEELTLHERGRIKPSRIFMGVSFLELNPNLQLYIGDSNITQGLIRRTLNPKIENFEEKITDYYASLLEKHKDHIQVIPDTPERVIENINIASRKKKKVLLLTHSAYWVKPGDLHWIELKDSNPPTTYHFGDPYTGKVLQFSERDIVNQLKLVQKEGFPLQLVTN